MAFMMGSLYDALRSAGAEDEKARKAAEVAGFENRIGSLAADVGLLKWMVGFNFALTLAMVGKLFLSGQ